MIQKFNEFANNKENEIKTILKDFGFDVVLARRLIFESFPNKLEKPKILDVGTGNGWLSINGAICYGLNTVAIDTSKQAIETAKNNAIAEGVDKKIDFRVEDASNTTFDNESFDYVISYGLLHHAKKRDKIIPELFRVCKNEGHLIISDLNKKGFKCFNKLYEMKKMKTEHNENFNIENFFNKFDKYSDEIKILNKEFTTIVVAKKGVL